MEKAREYFRAGAQAYSMGEYGAAIQAFEQAHALAPRPAVVFSIAQAERRQFFLDHDQKHLRRAVEMYRLYLEQEPQAARKVDAVQALSELEPMLVGAASGTLSQPTLDPHVRETSPAGGANAPPTRVMISSPAQGATISLDDLPKMLSPLVRAVEPGEHIIHIEAPGYRPAERRIVALSGELVTVDVPLIEKPALLVVRAPANAQLSIDGRMQGRCPFPRPIEVTSGVHLVTVSKDGFVGISREETLIGGQTTVFTAPLRRSRQRTAALLMLGASASALTTGAILAYISRTQETAAQTFLKSRGNRELTREDLEQYNSARVDRDRIRGAAWLAVGVGLGLGITSIVLRTFDAGSVETVGAQDRPSEQRKHKAPSVAAEPLVGPGFTGLGLHGAF